jgi:iron complex outermembrane receptor protein
MRTALLDTDPATAFDPFGNHSNTRFVLDRVFVTTNHIGWTSLLTEDLTLRGDAFNLPGGAVRFAVGGVHLTNHTTDNPDPLTASGQTTGATNFAPTKGSRDSWSVFEEVRVPVTGPTWNFPGAYSLELGFAEREEWYSDFGQTQRPKFDVRWQPIDQSLTLRAAYIEAFHAPALGELFSGAAQGFPGLTDPYNPTFASQYEDVSRGNPTLKPEIAYEYTYGGVLTPGKWWAPLQGLTLSADFVHIDIRGFTATIDVQQLLKLSETNPSQFLFTNGPGPLTQSWILRDGSATAPILTMNTPFQNLGRFITSAWDFEAVEVFDTNRLGHGDWGTFTATTNWTYLADADIQFVPGGPRQTIVGKYGGGFQGANGFGNFTHNRAYMSLFYDGPTGSWMQGIDTGMVVHYIGQYWDIGSDTAFDANAGRSLDRKVREWTTVDLILNYTFNLPPPAAQTEVAGYAKDGGKNVKMKDGKEKNVMPVSTAEYNPCGWRAWLNNTTLTLGVDNVADLEPPFVAGFAESGDAQGYDESVANDKGRLWYVAVKKRF